MFRFLNYTLQQAPSFVLDIFAFMEQQQPKKALIERLTCTVLWHNNNNSWRVSLIGGQRYVRFEKNLQFSMRLPLNSTDCFIFLSVCYI